MEIILNHANKLNNIKNNQYLVQLSLNPKLEKFVNSQDSFIDAVDNWSKILGLLLTQLPGDQERSVIINNLYDEHGSGDLTKSHVNTFRQFMISLNYSKPLELYDQNKLSYKIVKKFNNQLTNFITTNNWIQNVALLGMIEYIYITISTCIHNYVKQYIPIDHISHYSLHEIMDVKHSTELFELLVPYIHSHLADIEKGMQIGYRLFNELYDSLSTFL